MALSVEKFGPRLLATWTKATLERVVIKCPDLKTAQRLRFRLYALRRAMEADAHPLYKAAANVTITIVPNKVNEFYVIMETADADLDSILEKSGIENVDLDLELPDLDVSSIKFED